MTIELAQSKDKQKIERLDTHIPSQRLDECIKKGQIYGCGNYYIDDLDVTMLNYGSEPKPRKEILDQVLKIAALFAKYGVTDVYTHCISIDGETKTVTVAQAQVKY